MGSQSDIWNVITLPEASELWQLSRPTIIWQIWRGSLVARKAKGTWLISKKSMVKNFGQKEGRLQDASKCASVHMSSVRSGNGEI